LIEKISLKLKLKTPFYQIISYKMNNKQELIIHLPTQGCPYLVINKNPDELKDIQELVGFPNKSGLFQPICKEYFVIHPLFVEENKYWCLAHKLVKHNKPKIYCNENGINEHLCMNMACIYTLAARPLSGEVYLIVKKKTYDKICDKVGYRFKEFNFNEDLESDEE